MDGPYVVSYTSHGVTASSCCAGTADVSKYQLGRVTVDQSSITLPLLFGANQYEAQKLEVDGTSTRTRRQGEMVGNSRDETSLP